MNIKEKLTESLQPVMLVMFAVWGLVLADALLHPVAHERTGTVEIYALTSTSTAP